MAFICSSFASSSSLSFLNRGAQFALVTTRRASTVTCPLTFGGVSIYRRRLLHVSTPRASIETEVSQQMKVAMKAKDASRLKALRSIRAAFLNVLKADGADTLADSDAITALRKLAKMRQESIDMYSKGGRDDLAKEEQEELAIIEEWLPQLASEELMMEWAKQAIEKTGASSKSDMGKVMGYVHCNTFTYFLNKWSISCLRQSL